MRARIVASSRKPGNLSFGSGKGTHEPRSADRPRCVNRAPDISDLDDFVPERRRLAWELPTDSLNDEFFEDQYLLMLEQIYVLMETSLEVGPRGMPDGALPWSIPTVDEGDTTFEQYVTSVAQPDPMYKYPWDSLFLHARETQHLLAAVMNRMLHEKVFKDLLFGASDEQMKILQAQDDMLINEEGYQRTRLRAEHINMFLKGTPPPLFWKRVDEVTMDITRSYLPVLTWLRKTWIHEAPSLDEVHQQIHDLVSFTAWLSVCMRRSASVIEFDWPTPGERDLPSNNTENFDAQVYKNGLRRMKRHSIPGKSDKPRQARVMIAIAPSAWRHTMYREGYRKVRLQQKRAVFYPGLRSDTDEKKARETGYKMGLSEWAAMQRGKAKAEAMRNQKKLKRRLWWATFGVLLVLLVCAFFQHWDLFIQSFEDTRAHYLHVERTR
ncbi:hypothetical protein ACHAQH_004917 [Verticillium albo-atrum]